MRLIIYVIAYPILWFISILPFRVLYAFSDFVYLVVYYIVQYRKKTVRENIAMALPYLSQKERLTVN
jgi:KDO2-lipid IV(A) lauroyltransferase